MGEWVSEKVLCFTETSGKSFTHMSLLWWVQMKRISFLLLFKKTETCTPNLCIENELAAYYEFHFKTDQREFFKKSWAIQVSFSFIFTLCKQTIQFFTTNQWEKLSNQYMAPEIEPTTSWTWFVSHNHWTRAPVQPKWNLPLTRFLVLWNVSSTIFQNFPCKQTNNTYLYLPAWPHLSLPSFWKATLGSLWLKMISILTQLSGHTVEMHNFCCS